MAFDLTETFFNDTWRVYAHHPTDADWTHKSYAPIGMISSVADFWTVWNSCAACVDRTMLFVMREHVFPSWDDPACIDVSIGSIIVDSASAPGTFRDIVQRALGETLIANNNNQTRTWSDVNGVSIGPKNGFCVVKVWTASRDADATQFRFPPRVDRAKVRFQPCRTHIAGARTVRPRACPAHCGRA